jgi:hypothetical protein
MDPHVGKTIAGRLPLASRAKNSQAALLCIAGIAWRRMLRRYPKAVRGLGIWMAGLTLWRDYCTDVTMKNSFTDLQSICECNINR